WVGSCVGSRDRVWAGLGVRVGFGARECGPVRAASCPFGNGRAGVARRGVTSNSSSRAFRRLDRKGSGACPGAGSPLTYA
ncbi:MAG: hypothetical protein M3083_19435, partial [Actinomycetota bacterium]|nr:hypothetical protein [Actinomycetota bacterium]